MFVSFPPPWKKAPPLVNIPTDIVLVSYSLFSLQMVRVSMVMERYWSSLEISWPPASHGMHLPGVIWWICLRVPSCMVRRKTTGCSSAVFRLCSPTDLRSPSHSHLRSIELLQCVLWTEMGLGCLRTLSKFLWDKMSCGWVATRVAGRISLKTPQKWHLPWWISLIQDLAFSLAALQTWSVSLPRLCDLAHLHATLLICNGWDTMWQGEYVFLQTPLHEV